VTALADIRVAFRGFRRRPAFVGVIVTTLALALGANIAVFSVVDSVVLQPLDVTHPDELVTVYQRSSLSEFGAISIRDYQSIVAHNTSLGGTTAFWNSVVTLERGDLPRDLSVAFTSDNYFAVLGVHATLGRTYSDDERGRVADVVVLSDHLWRADYGSDQRIIGRRIRVNGRQVTVIGVTPSRFAGTTLAAVPDAWIPMSILTELDMGALSHQGVVNDALRVFHVFGRMLPGVSRDVVAKDPVIANLGADPDTTMAEVPSAAKRSALPHASVVPLVESAATGGDRTALLRLLRLLFLVVAITLVLTCLNVANMLMVRAAERAREFGVRVALGARGIHIIRQLLTESLLLAGGGIIAGLAVALATMRALGGFTLPGGATLDRVHPTLDGRVLIFAIGLASVTAVGFGLAPALYARRCNVIDTIRRDAGHGFAIRGRIVSLSIQVGISLMLVIGALLFIRSAHAALSTELGFDPGPVAVLSARPRLDGRHLDVIRPYLQLVAAMEKTPGIDRAAAASHLPLTPASQWPFSPVEGRVGAASTMVAIVSATPAYFDVLGIALEAGRRFDDRDRPDAARVAIVNESLGRAFWPGESPLGQRLFFLGQLPYTVVGVVADTKNESLQDHGVPVLYAPMLQQDLLGAVHFIVRGRDSRVALLKLQRNARIIVPDLKSPRPTLMADRIATAAAPQRFGATLLSGFAVIALCICGLGIYGTVAYVVARGKSEIGVRRALGARRRDIMRLVLGHCAIALGCGVALGVVGAATATRLFASLLYGVGPLDGVAFVSAIVVITGIGIAAAVFPTARAVRVDPSTAMRSVV
jgi:putative ABC transport system permease protein